MSSDLDRWASWLLHRRDGGDPGQRQKALEHLVPVRDRVLDDAHIVSGDTLFDVGAGDGLIAFGALDRVRPGGHVIASDISGDLVNHMREAATELGVASEMSFVHARAEDLGPVSSESVDVVTTRSVLIYVEDKAAAFNEFHRVLSQGGRISLFEPINNYFPDSPEEFWNYDSSAVSDLVEKIWRYEGWGEDAYRDDPMMNFNTKDLVRLAESAGFAEIHLDLTVDVERGTWATSWQTLLEMSPNPNSETVGETLRGALTDDEQRRFEAAIRPQADAGRGKRRSAFAYLQATKR